VLAVASEGLAYAYTPWAAHTCMTSLTMASVLTVLLSAAAAIDWEVFQGVLWSTDQCGTPVSPTVVGYNLSHCQQACQGHPTCTAVNYDVVKGKTYTEICVFFACPCGKSMKPTSKEEGGAGYILKRYCQRLRAPPPPPTPL
jgi:hypothetical protein